MRVFFGEPLCITGTFGEKNAKSVLTFVMAIAYVLLLSTTFVRATNVAIYYTYLTAGIEMVAIALLKKRVHPLWKAVPMCQYTICCISYFVMLLVTKTLIFSRHAFIIIYDLLVGFLLIRATQNMVSTAKYGSEERQYSSSVRFRLPLVIIVGLDLFASMVALSCNPDKPQIIVEFLTRQAFYAGIILVATPDCILINVKRIFRIGAMFLSVMVSSAAGLKLLSVLLAMQLSFRTLLILASMLSSCVVMIGAFAKEFISSLHKGRWIKEHYSYETNQHSFKDNYVSSSNEYLLEKALRRNYLTEYSCRMWNVTYHAADISKVQSRLNKLQEERASLLSNPTAPCMARLMQIDNEAADLLGKLSIDYHFTNGFDECPIDVLLGDEIQ